MEISLLEYVDYNSIFIPVLKFYKGGLSLPNKNNIVKVTENEKLHLLRIKNGNKNSFVEKKTRKQKEPIESIIEDSNKEEVN